jgi:hypothetical protein
VNILINGNKKVSSYPLIYEYIKETLFLDVNGNAINSTIPFTLDNSIQIQDIYDKKTELNRRNTEFNPLPFIRKKKN